MLIILKLFKVDEALSLKNTEIAKELSLPPVKLHCSSNFNYKCLIIIQLECIR